MHKFAQKTKDRIRTISEDERTAWLVVAAIPLAAVVVGSFVASKLLPDPDEEEE